MTLTDGPHPVLVVAVLVLLGGTATRTNPGASPVDPASDGSTAGPAPRRTADSSEYVARTWTTEEGLPNNSVRALEQAQSGALWIGTLDGLARFEGRSFTTFDAAATDGLAGNRILSLHQSRSGTLWIGTATGVSVFQGGHFQQIDGITGGRAIEEAPGGAVWVGMGSGFYRVTQGKATAIPLPDTLEGSRVTDIERIGTDSVWVVADRRLLLYRGGEFERPGPLFKTGGAVQRIATAGRETLYVVTGSHLVSIQDGDRRRYRHDGGRVRSVQSAPSEGAWLATMDKGVLQLYGTSLRPVPTSDQTPGKPFVLTRDEGGQWWVGTRSEGLVRLRSRLFRRPNAGLPGNSTIHGVYADDHGAIWAGTFSKGLLRLDGSTRARWTVEDGLPGSSVRTMAEDGAGTLWVATDAGLVRRRGSRFEPVRSPEGTRFRHVRALYRDSTGTLWFANQEQGLYRYRDGTLSRVLSSERRLSSRVFALHRTGDQTLWIGTRSRGVARYRGDTLTWYGSEEGLPYPTVRDIHETADGTIWVATYGGGIARFEGNQFTAVTPENGLPDGTVHAIREAPTGIFWMTSNAGVFRVPRAQLEAVANGTRDRIYPQMFGLADGMPAQECNGNFQPALAKGEQGRLWIPTMEGLAVVDPRRAAYDIPDSMSVRVIGARVDGAPRPPDSLRLAPSAYRLKLRFTAVSLRHADDLSFRFRLDGGRWTPARSRRVAEYTGLEPGPHRFEVQATLDGKTWYSLSAPLRFTVVPHFYETGWFRVLAVLVVLGLVGGGYWLRVRVLRRRQETLRRMVNERTRKLAEEKRKTERQAERLEALDAEKNRFFANVSHELRTPLTILLGSLQDLLDGAFGEISVPVREQLEIMHSNVERLCRLTDQLLDLARLETTEPTLDPEPRDLVALLRRVTRRFVPMAERRGLRLALETEVEAHPCRFDPEKVEKIAGNLVSNAVKNTPEGGTVTVCLALEGDAPPEAVFRVTDTGPGIPPDQQDGIFERFARADTEGSAEKGTGLGLALAREHTELHDGTIEVTSTPGEGSTFTVRLPLPTVDPEAVETPENGQPDPSNLGTSAGDGVPGEESDRPVLLVVEDNADVRAYLRRHLTDTYRVVEATHGADGLDTAREVEPDLILTDLMMPGMGGIELCRRVRNGEALARVPIVLLTARAAEEDAVAGLEAGADAYVTKPFSIEELKARLARLLEAHWAGASGAGPTRRRSPDVEAPSADEDFLDRVTEVIDEHRSHSGFTVDDLAAEVGLSPRQLQRKLKRLTGETPAAFIRRYRLDAAAQLLEEGAGTVSEIAYEVGFGTADTFARRFKEQFGCPPSEYPDAASGDAA